MSEQIKTNRNQSRSRSRSNDKKHNQANNAKKDKETNKYVEKSSPEQKKQSRSSSLEKTEQRQKKKSKSENNKSQLTLYTNKKNCINYIKGICKKSKNECDDFHPEIQENPIQPEDFNASFESMKVYKEDDAKLFNFCMEYEPIKQPSSNDQIILIRHALSYYNFAAFRFFHETGISYNDPRSVVYQLRREYIDSALHPLGEQMCKNNAKFLSNYSFHTVFVSPLRRTLQTASILFENHPQKQSIKFVVLPYCTEILSKVCDVSDLKSVKQEFNDGMFDFSLFDEFKLTDSSWQIDNMADQDLQTYLRAMISQDSEGKSIQDILLDECQKVFPGQVEKHQQLYERTLKTKSFINEYIVKNSIDTTQFKIGLVSHHGFLNSFTSEGKALNGFIKNGRSFENCEAYPYSI